MSVSDAHEDVSAEEIAEQNRAWMEHGIPLSATPTERLKMLNEAMNASEIKALERLKKGLLEEGSIEEAGGVDMAIDLLVAVRIDRA
jgi:hypothetical protein